MATLRVTTDDGLDEHFEGVMIDAEDPFIGKIRVPGWKCRHCGWTVGTISYPPSHDCPGIEKLKLETELRELRQAAAILASYIPDIDEDRGVVQLRVNGVVRDWTPDLYAALVTLCRSSKNDKQT